MKVAALAPDECSDSSFAVKDCSKSKAGAQENSETAKRKVVFKPGHDTLEFPLPDEDECGERWYTRLDYDMIKQRNSSIVRKMKHGTFSESSDQTFRGLEHKLREGFKQRQENKFRALNAVLEEQDRQYALKICKPDLIQAAYTVAARAAVEKAQAMGAYDATKSYSYPGGDVDADEVSEVTVDESFNNEFDNASVGTSSTCSSTQSSVRRKGIRRLFSRGTTSPQMA